MEANLYIEGEQHDNAAVFKSRKREETMPYNIDWYVENQVIYAKMAGEVTPQEFRTLLQSSALMIDEVEIGEVHIINDVSQLESMPNFVQIVQAIPKSPQSQMGWMLIVGETTPIKRFWGEAFARVAPIKYKRLDRLEQALGHLRKEDPTIDWEHANPLLMAEDWPLLRGVE